MNPLSPDVLGRMSKELSVPPSAIQAVADLLAGGATAPFIARYRKDGTGGLREGQVRAVCARLRHERGGPARPSRAAVREAASRVRARLLSPPLGARSAIGIMPASDDDYHCALVAADGVRLDHCVLDLSGVGNTEARARSELLRLLRHDRGAAFAVASGPGGRRAERFIGDLIRENRLAGFVVTAGSGATHRASAGAPDGEDSDALGRAAVSVARWLQDPLAETVRIGPSVFFAGDLAGAELEEVVESCVNSVGPDVNRADAALLRHISGLDRDKAAAVVAHRAEHGPFAGRQQLLDVPGIDAHVFEQAAGFVRVCGGSEPLDETTVHPERYELVTRIARDHGMTVSELIGQPRRVAQLETDAYVSDEVGRPVLEGILAALREGARDPRGVLEPRGDGARTGSIDDLTVGMAIEGVVTKIVDYGAFVNVGVEKDGLVHISQLADQFVEDPHVVVGVGDALALRVLEVDRQRGRISLSARSEHAPGAEPPAKAGRRARPGKNQRSNNEPGRNERGKNRQGKNEQGKRRPADRNKPGGRGHRQPQFKNNPLAALGKLKLDE